MLHTGTRSRQGLRSGRRWLLQCLFSCSTSFLLAIALSTFTQWAYLSQSVNFSDRGGRAFSTRLWITCNQAQNSRLVDETEQTTFDQMLKESSCAAPGCQDTGHTLLRYPCSLCGMNALSALLIDYYLNVVCTALPTLGEST